MGTHHLGTQIKGLYKLVSVTKEKLFVSYEIDREEDTFSSEVCLCFTLKFSQ